jgi:hypothetical protein
MRKRKCMYHMTCPISPSNPIPFGGQANSCAILGKPPPHLSFNNVSSLQSPDQVHRAWICRRRLYETISPTIRCDALFLPSIFQVVEVSLQSKSISSWRPQSNSLHRPVGIVLLQLGAPPPASSCMPNCHRIGVCLHGENSVKTITP